ncbi:raffinose/stachyose/melibiose transport system permease protein [Devosia sp. UYZn731]|uniref:carbohydrate ABC transporter permease n=1 Tax=Devosia sp. UYZn731 TaxID=3156345 RepID=UPI00339B260D
MSSAETANTYSLAQRSLTTRKLHGSSHPWWFAAPAIAVMAAFFVVPNALNFVYPFTDWSSFKNTINFVGFSNFADVLADGTVLKALRATLIYAALVAVFQNVFGLALALLFERDTALNRFCRAMFFLPVLISALAVGYIFQALLATGGALNGTLSAITGQQISIAWLGNTSWTIIVVTLIHTWKWVGLTMIIYIAGLKSVSVDVVEAASIDGANRWQTFWRVRFPMIAPAVTFNVATAMIGAMNSFDIVLATTKGGPADSTQVLNVYMFKIFGQGLFAQATVTSLSLFIVVVLIAIPLIAYLRRRENIL